ncbi:MAG: hypothetical protein V1727_01520 [Candidatus Omnitrophota bacterium]
MNKKIKLLLVFLGVASLGAIVIAAGIYISAQAQITQYAQKEAELTKENQFLTEQSTVLKQKADAAQKESAQLQEKLKVVNATLNKLGQEHMLLASQLEALVKEKDTLLVQNKELTLKIEDQAKLIAQAQEAAAAVGSSDNEENLAASSGQASLSSTELGGQVSIGTIEQAQQAQQTQQLASVQLPPIVVKAEEASPAAQNSQESGLYLPRVTQSRLVEIMEPQETLNDADSAPGDELSPEGRVITVNKKHKFVVINIGGDEGVKKGMIFNVYRNNQRIGRLEVIEIRKNIAACDVREIDPALLKVNDIVRR